MLILLILPFVVVMTTVATRVVVGGAVTAAVPGRLDHRGVVDRRLVVMIVVPTTGEYQRRDDRQNRE